MLRRTSLGLAWLVTGVIVYVTLCPIQDRPKTGHPDLERFAAFFMVTALFAVGLPAARRTIGVATVLAAFLLEFAQLLVPGRDAHVHDAVVKAIGGVAGLALASWIDRWPRDPRDPDARDAAADLRRDEADVPG